MKCNFLNDSDNDQIELFPENTREEKMLSSLLTHGIRIHDVHVGDKPCIGFVNSDQKGVLTITLGINQKET